MKAKMNPEFIKDLAKITTDSAQHIANKIDQNKEDDQSIEGVCGKMLATSYANTSIALNQIAAIAAIVTDNPEGGLIVFKDIAIMAATLSDALRNYLDHVVDNFDEGNLITEFTDARMINESAEMIEKIRQFRKFVDEHAEQMLKS